MTKLIGLSSSLRTRTPEETLELACKTADCLGITRVVDTTWLDKIGVPVFSSIRPRAQNNSLCVNAGKGLRSIEAKVGAYMEAIEFALAEFTPSRDLDCLVAMTPRELNELYQPYFKFVDFCPNYQLIIDADIPIFALKAKEVMNGGEVFIPAELVFHPFNDNKLATIFGTSTNGLCSGNTLEEAAIHGVFEVIERDIQSFYFIQEESYLVAHSTYPPNIKELLYKCQQAGLDLQIRYTPNRYGLAYIMAFLIEPSLEAPIAISTGYGTHTSASIASVRAITEAIQSRLSYIHGGRDDLIDRYDYFEQRDKAVELSGMKTLHQRAYNKSRQCEFSFIPSFDDLTDTKSVTTFIHHSLRKNGINQYFLYDLSQPGDELHVCKIVIPTLEGFQPNSKVRVGPRLKQAILSKVNEHDS
ncbi:YcaO-like family protein [Vibrio ostreicida]|uniref:YcaO-like family protein n=1 Tax=Vibrio ostreicida TaxID=526588 RepID=A0ABT8BTX4_9VIBR|nr:YcaO-like family protein [Vibrio ostreicida]MDN3610443.1 YcaO-like family protein [Vibrio ostreicida]NPD07553.1 hypothetical protein [Vibrio ostreicida]